MSPSEFQTFHNKNSKGPHIAIEMATSVSHLSSFYPPPPFCNFSAMMDVEILPQHRLIYGKREKPEVVRYVGNSGNSVKQVENVGYSN